MLQFLMEDYNADVQYPKDFIFIQDGNPFFHTIVNLPPIFGGICLQILDLMVSIKSFIFSTDSYHRDSIKMQERQQPYSANIGPQDVPRTPSSNVPRTSYKDDYPGDVPI